MKSNSSKTVLFIGYLALSYPLFAICTEKQMEEATKLLNRIHSYNLSYKEKIIKTDEIIQKNRECHFSKIFAYRYLLEGKYFLQRGRNEEAKNAFNN